MTTNLVWFRNDLRLHDNEALKIALKGCARLLTVYCFDPRHYADTEWGFPKSGTIRTEFLRESVKDLQQNLHKRGNKLLIRHDKPENIIPELVKHYNVNKIIFQEEPMSEEKTVEKNIIDKLPKIEIIRVWGHTIYHKDDVPEEIMKAIPTTFTQFFKLVEKDGKIRELIHLSDDEKFPKSVENQEEMDSIPSLSDLGLDPEKTASPKLFEGGETAGLRHIHNYFWKNDLAKTYKETRNGMVGMDYSSKFAAWLSLGCVSPKFIYYELIRYEKERVSNDSTHHLFYELIWRDFMKFYGLYYGDRLFYLTGPKKVSKEDVEYWKQDMNVFNQWKNATTGFPFVDACMTELNKTGFMSNRGRQNVASFLNKNLEIDWRMGAAWFESQLVDYDVTSNWGNWGYVAGVGADPRAGRYFNIDLQAKNYDKDGAVVREWLPVLSKLDDEFIHCPYKLNRGKLGMCGVHLGENYPKPMIDLAKSYEVIRHRESEKAKRNNQKKAASSQKSKSNKNAHNKNANHHHQKGGKHPSHPHHKKNAHQASH